MKIFRRVILPDGKEAIEQPVLYDLGYRYFDLQWNPIDKWNYETTHSGRIKLLKVCS